MDEKLLSEEELEGVNGGVGKGQYNKYQHVCGIGKTGKLEFAGYGASGQERYRCKVCGEEGRVVPEHGHPNYCRLVK